MVLRVLELGEDRWMDRMDGWIGQEKEVDG
jgi:hypothetical protein